MVAGCDIWTAPDWRTAVRLGDGGWSWSLWQRGVASGALGGVDRAGARIHQPFGLQLEAWQRAGRHQLDQEAQPLVGIGQRLAKLLLDLWPVADTARLQLDLDGDLVAQ